MALRGPLAGRKNSIRASASSSAPTDPFFSSVKMLAINDNAANGSGTFIDQEATPKILTAGGGAVYSNTSPPTGMTTTGDFATGGGRTVTSPNPASLELGAGDFTIEYMANYSALGTQILVCKDSAGAAGTRSWHCAIINNTTYRALGFFVGTAQTSVDVALGTSTGAWRHYATSRNGANLNFYVDGILTGGTFNIGATVIDSSTGNFAISGFANGATTATAFISNVRITIGVGRYPTAFTPSNLPYPTS